MRSVNALLASVAGLCTLGSTGQVNFYYDLNCKDYAGSVYPPSYTLVGFVLYLLGHNPS